MQPFVIKKADFLVSVSDTKKLPEPLGCEIAIVGKSNVGKSSLINGLCNNRKLAKTSATPGKTRLINYFLLNDSFYLVDLPGYGFAKASKQEKSGWGTLMESYLSCGRVKHIFLLTDIRHDPTEDDRQMFAWIVYYGIPFTIIATKSDKIAKGKRKQTADHISNILEAPKGTIVYSSETGEGREELLERIGQIVS